MPFDIGAAVRAGYTLPEIADYLGQQRRFDVNAARQAGYDDTEILQFLTKEPPKPTVGGHVKEFFKGIPSGAIGLGETAGVGAAAMLPDEYEEQARKFIKEQGAALRKPFEAEPGYEDAVSRRLGEAVGSTVPFFLTGPLGTAGRAAAVGMGAAAGAGEARLAAEEKGVTGTDRALATALGTPVGLLDLVAPELNIGKQLITRALVTGGIEGATEAAQKVAQNLIAKGIYDPNQPILAGSGEEGAYGAGAGALTRLLVDMVAGRRAHVPPPATPPATAGLPSTAGLPVGTQGELFEGAQPGYRAVPLGDRAFEEKLGATRLKQMTLGELRDQYDVLEREMERLQARYNQIRQQPELALEGVSSAAEQQELLRQAQRLDFARQEIAGEIKKQSKGLTKEERARTEAIPGQAALDFEAVSAAEEERPPFELGQPSLQLAPEEEVAPVETRPVAESDFKRMGIGATNKKLRQAILGKDLADPAQRAEVRDLLTDYANDPNRSAKIIEGVNSFLSSPIFMEQAELDLKAPRKPRAKKVKEAVSEQPSVESTEPVSAADERRTAVADERGAVPAEGVGAPVGAGLGDTGAVAGQPDVREGIQSAPLAEEVLREEPTAEPAVTEPVAAEPTAPVAEAAPAVPPTVTEEPKAPAAPEDTEYLEAKDATKKLMEATKLPFSVARNLVNDKLNQFDLISQQDLDGLVAQAKTPAKKAKAEKPLPYTPEQREEAEQHAKDLGGTVVWQDGDLALIRGYSSWSGQPVYAAALGANRSKVDVESFTGKQISDADKARLIDAKKKIEAADAKKHAAKPFPSFTQDHILTSAGTSRELGEIVRGWTKLLGLKANIYVTTVEDARADRDKFTGPYRAIGSAGLDPNEIGSMRRLPNGDYYITFTKSTSKTAMLETLAHELGHVHMKEMYKNASPQLQASIEKEFQQWLVDQKGKTGRELVDALRAKTSAKQTKVAEGKMADDLRSYWRSFDEWYADQTARWATTNEKPISVVEKFFARLGRALRTFFGNIKNKRYLPNETFVQYLEEVKNAAVQDATVPDTGEASQMRKEVDLTPEGQKAAELNARMGSLSGDTETNVDDIAKGLAGIVKFPKGGPSLGTRLRRELVDKDATVNEKLQNKFNNALIDSMGNVRGDLLVDQAQDAPSFAENVMDQGGIRINKEGLAETYKTDANMGAVFDKITELGKRLGSPSEAFKLAHNAFIAFRASELQKHNDELNKQIDAALAKGNKKAANLLDARKVTVQIPQAEIDAGLEAMQTFPELREAHDIFTKYKNNLVDFLEQTGRLNAETARSWKEAVGYIPWTRVEEEVNLLDEADPVAYKTGVLSVSKLPVLDRNGSTKEIANVFDNMIGLTNWAVKTGLKTRAARTLAEGLPDATKLTTDDQVKKAQKHNRDRLIFVYENGERTPYLLGSPLDMAAFATNSVVMGPILKSFNFAQNILRGFVTHMPAFALSQLIQDGTYRGMLLSGVKNPFSLPPKVFKNFALAVTGQPSQAMADLARLGVAGVYDGMPEHMAERARVKYGLKERNAFQKAWDGLEKFSLAADLAVRSAIYEQTMQETGDQRLALYRAKEYINFKRSGNSQTIRAMRHMVPFMNAYIQGMDVLVRTMQGKGVSLAEKQEAQRLFLATGFKLAALSAAYALLVSGDDDYEGLDEYERDKNYIIPGTGLKIPVAPEVGFMFKVIPERLVRYIVSQGTERPQDATSFYKGFRDAFANAYGGTNLTPQLVKPALEVMVNYSFFTNNPIVGESMKNVDPKFQFRDGTSELAKLFGNVGISPLKADYIIRGYTGMLGAFALDATDAIANPDRMSKPIAKLPQVSTFMYDPNGRGYKSEFYTFREEVDKVVDTVNMFKREGRAEELQEYLTPEKIQLYGMQGVTNRIEKELAQLRQYRNIITNDKTLSDDQKREKVDEIMKLEKQLLLAYNMPRIRGMAGM